MILVIETQGQENYAAHGGFTGDYRWKMKGGSSFKVTNLPQNVDPASVVEMVRLDIEDTTNDYFRSEIIDYHLEADDWMSPFERSQLEYEGEIRYKEPTINYADYWEMVA